MSKKLGRPTLYTPELADLICKRVATHVEGTTRLCSMYDDMPNEVTIRDWRFTYPDFSLKYLDAKRFQSELLAESVDDVLQERHVYFDDKGNERVDSGSVARSVAIANGRKWTASRLAPRIYGDKKELESLSYENNKIKDELEALRLKLNEQNKAEY